MKAKPIISIALLAAMLISLAACGDTASTGDDTSAPDSTDSTTPAETKPAYDYPDKTFEGKQLRFLNPTQVWQMYTYLDHEVQTGEIIDDAVYDRNRMLEEKFGFEMAVEEIAIDQLHTRVQTVVTADEDAYDVAYVRGLYLPNVISSGYAMNLYNVPGLNLDKPWWNQSVVESGTLSIDGTDALYFALNELSLCAFDLVWTVFFNEDMMTDLGMDMPYDIVREGKWTIDEFHKQLKQGVSLNGDESHAWNEAGNSVYGLTSFNRLIDAMVIGAGNSWTKRDGESFKLNVENDRFYTTCEKLASIFGTQGEYIEANQNGIKYDNIFKADRALFYGGEVKASGVFRDMNSSFGILPLPKLDEDQDGYYGWMNYDTPTMIIPATNQNLEMTGILLDALSYHSYVDVLPKYYEIRISQKSLRGDDSIEMLSIIRDGLCFEAGLSYGWTLTLSEQIHNAIGKGDSSVASIIATNKDSIAGKIEDTIEAITD